MTIQKVNIYIDDRVKDIDLSYTDSEPWKVEAMISENLKLSAEGEDLFQAFAALRQNGGEYNIKFLCIGSRLNVYPSPMTRSMSDGILAYVLHSGIQARRKDLVKIFDDFNDLTLIAAPSEQERFYYQWLESLG